MRLIRIALAVLTASAAGSVVAPAAETPRGSPASGVTVKLDSHSPTAGIQEAIDALGTDGGVVIIIPPGEYLLR